MSKSSAALFAVAVWSTVTLARNVVPEDAAAAYDFVRQSVVLAKDGSYRQTIEWQLELLRDTARGDYGTRRLFYRDDVEQLTVVEAATLNGKERVAVPAQHREDRPVASNRPGFDATRQVLLSYPEVRVGSRLYLKFELVHRRPAIDGFYSRLVLFSGLEPRREQKLDIQSELPLFVEPRDPGSRLTVKLDEVGGRFHLAAETKGLVHEGVADEERPVVLEADRTGLVVSTSVDFGPFVPLARSYEEALNAPLPPVFATVAEEAALEKEPLDRIDAVTSRLADRVRYMGDWRSVAGRYVPRGHSVVLESGFGDCKDYATSTAAMLRRLGMTAYVALVERAVDPEPISRLPNLGHFNHAIVALELDGKVLWIDPTNERSFAHGIPEDIQGRIALILKPDRPVLSSIPLGSANDSVSETDVAVTFERGGGQRLRWRKDLSGLWAWEWTGVERGQPRRSVERRLQRFLVLPWELREIKFSAFDLASRIVRPIHFEADARVDMSLASTSAGTGYHLPDDDTLSSVRTIDGATRFSRFSLGPPGVRRRKLEVKRVTPVGRWLPHCKLEFGGIAASRRTTRITGGFRVTESVATTARYLEPEAMRTKEFHRFQEQLRRCFSRAAVILEPVAGAAQGG